MAAAKLPGGFASEALLFAGGAAKDGLPCVSGRVTNARGAGISALVRLRRRRRTASIDIAAQRYANRDGAFSFPIAPGAYVALVYRGPEYEYFEFPLEIFEAQDARLEIRLHRIFDMPSLGWFGGDAHQHSDFSDGKQSVAEMALFDVAVGLHWGVASDHNCVAQNVPFLEACAGLDTDGGYPFLGIGGDEITTGAGHVNVWEPKDGTGAYLHIDDGAVPGMDAPLEERKVSWARVAEKAREIGALSHINHPFGDSVLRKFGKGFGSTFLDEGLDWVENRDFILKFDATEMWNGGSGFMDGMYYFGSKARHPFEGMANAFFQWFRLLNTGARFPSLGTTDCHNPYGCFIEEYNRMVAGVKRGFFGLLPPLPKKLARRLMGVEGALLYANRKTVKRSLENVGLLPGTPRTYVYTGGELSMETLAQGIREGRSFVTSGPLILAALDGSMPGETAAARDGATLRLEILCHKPLSRALVIADGELILSIPLKNKTHFRGEMKLPLRGRKWLLVYAEGKGNYAYAHTNPIYLA